jgi:hypothetical protein
MSQQRVYEIWSTVIGANTDRCAVLVSSRATMGLTPTVLAANLLDHRFCGANLCPLDVAKAIDYIAGLHEDALCQVTNFMARSPPYAESLFGEGYKAVNPFSWWKAGIRRGFPEGFAKVAQGLVSGVSSSAGLERQFSTLGFTYGKLRSHLGTEKAGKLAFLYRQLNK